MWCKVSCDQVQNEHEHTRNFFEGVHIIWSHKNDRTVNMTTATDLSQPFNCVGQRRLNKMNNKPNVQ